MKSCLVLGLLFQILSGSTVLAFQSAPLATLPSASISIEGPSLFHQRQTTFFRQPSVVETSLRQPLLASTIMVDSAATEVSGPAMANHWDRVCTTVQTSTSQLNALRQKIQKSGVATALSYSLVSNAFTSVAVSLAWYGFSTKTGLSPICPGQWKPFLGWYGGFYAVNSLLKPIRFMVALAVVPYTEQVMATFQSQFSDSKKAAIACSTTLLFVTSASMMAAGIGLASLMSGTPIFPISAVL